MNIPPRSYVCGYCGNTVGPNQGWQGTASGSGSNVHVFIHVCSACNGPTYFDRTGQQWPGVAVGETVEALPTDVEAVYNEARRCMSVSAYTTAVMACRKLLMHIAVEKGAESTNKSFKYYVDWMVEHHYVPPGGAGWVDVIRDDANEVNHEIVMMDQHRATQNLSFVALLLKFIYEFPARVAGGAVAPEGGPTPAGHLEGSGGVSGLVE